MEHLRPHEILKRIILVLSFIWGSLLVPLIIMIVFILQGHGGFASHDELSWSILYLNLVAFPIVIIVSTALSWIMLQKKRYGTALTFILLPFLNLLIELVAVDVVLLFS